MISDEHKVEKIMLYNEIEEKLRIHRITMWKVLRYALDNSLMFGGTVASRYKEWKTFKDTNSGVSYIRLQDYSSYINAFCDSLVKKKPIIRMQDIHKLVFLHNISIRDLYVNWKDYHNSISGTISNCSYRTFESCYYRDPYSTSGNKFGRKRIEELLFVIEEMINGNYHYTKKTTKIKKW